MTRFIIKRRGDDEIHLFVDDFEVGYTDHDLSGWDGLELAESLFVNIANHLGFEIEEEEYEDD